MKEDKLKKNVEFDVLSLKTIISTFLLPRRPFLN